MSFPTENWNLELFTKNRDFSLWLMYLFVWTSKSVDSSSDQMSK